jgi:hypothetical protein
MRMEVDCFVQLVSFLVIGASKAITILGKYNSYAASTSYII